MSATASQGQAERAELDAILSSGIFSRAPNLANFLKYVCDRHFEGDAAGIKEYCIAVEALKRPEDFDQKKDSIVRVEAHRLRKRLADYYQRAGADHAVKIEIPNGQYAPRFIYKDEWAAEVVELPPHESLVYEAPPPAEEVLPPKRAIGRFAWIVLGLLSILITVVVLARSRGANQPPREIWQGPSTQPVPGEFRMLAGYQGPPFTDRQGRTWQPDAFYDGGVSVPLPADRNYEALPDPAFSKSQREGDFQYAIPVRQGTYELHLYFIEAAHSGGPDDPHLFRISINGKLALNYFDVLNEAGASNRMTSRAFRDVVPGSDGRIHLAFEQQGRKAILTALELLSSKPGRVRPVRIVAARQSVTDSDGSLWMADQYAVGGMLVERKDSIGDSELKTLYAGEHYGNFAYHIPVPPGKYRVKLYFAETFFGSKLPFAGSGETGARLFNVFCDGTTLLRNFDVTREAGGANRAVVRTFDNLEPNAQGKIVLEFVPIRNYAEVNAIEVTQMD
jgi:hypothetical protein